MDIYTVSHSCLLLVSQKTDVNDTRMEILFHDVRSINIDHLLHGITIEHPVKSMFIGHYILRETPAEEEVNLYNITSGDRGYSILAKDIFWSENDGAYHDHSHFHEMLPFLY